MRKKVPGMLNEFIGRENDIFDMLNKLKNKGIDFVLIGGYAVSAFKHRFSVDADIVVRDEDIKKIADILTMNNFQEYNAMNIENSYNGAFKAFVRKTALPVTVDLLINSVTSRQTNASWSFELFKNNAIEKKISGTEKSITVKIPVKELLIATKIHSSRLTDIRDIVAICAGTDIEKIIGFTKRGDLKKLDGCIKRFKETMSNKNFIDAFKGVFSIEKFPIENLKLSEKIIDQMEKAIRKK